jgi:hypothetical protein
MIAMPHSDVVDAAILRRLPTASPASMNLGPATEHAMRLFLEKVAVSFDMTEAILFGSRARQLAIDEDLQRIKP